MDEEVSNRPTVDGDLLVATLLVGPCRGEFQAIQRALAGQRLALVTGTGPIFTGRIALAHQHGQQGILTELVVIVEVFVAQAQSIHPLGDQFLDGMLDPLRIAVIGETRRELADDAADPLRLPEQQGPGVGGDRPAVKAGHDFPPTEPLEQE